MRNTSNEIEGVLGSSFDIVFGVKIFGLFFSSTYNSSCERHSMEVKSASKLKIDLLVVSSATSVILTYLQYKPSKRAVAFTYLENWCRNMGLQESQLLLNHDFSGLFQNFECVWIWLVLAPLGCCI